MNTDSGKFSSYLRIAFYLSIFTIGYNIIEGTVSTYFGAGDETMALFGFGVDSFVEVISGVGVAHMILRMKREAVSMTDRFEKQALYITGTAFYILAAGLVIGGAVSIYKAAVPETTIAGIIIAGISIVTMFFLYRRKLEYGRLLDSDAVIADANCTKTCFYLSFILLASSLIFEIFTIPYIDAAGGIAIAWYAFSEGREAFEKAGAGRISCGCDHCG